MNDKQQLLDQIRSGLATGTINETEVRSLLSAPQPTPAPVAPVNPAPQKPNSLSAVDVMFYVAGFVLFGAVMSIIAQSWDIGNPLTHIMLSAGLGLGMWSLAYYLTKSRSATDVNKGLVNALVLTGSLSTIVGFFIITNEIIGGFGEVNLFAGAITFAVLGALHIFYDKLVQRDLTLALGVLLSTLTFPALLFSFLVDKNLAPDVWILVIIASAVLLLYAAKVVGNIYPARKKLQQEFYPLGTAIILLSMFIGSFTDYGVAWLFLLFITTFGLFYVSIINQSKSLLGNASAFLMLAVVTVAFKYFSGIGITLAFIVAATGLLGAAAVASSINKKYFKNPTNNPPN